MSCEMLAQARLLSRDKGFDGRFMGGLGVGSFNGEFTSIYISPEIKGRF